MQAPNGFNFLCNKVTFIMPHVSTTSLINWNLNAIAVKVNTKKNAVIVKVGAKMQLKSGAKRKLATVDLTWIESSFSCSQMCEL